MTTTQTSADSDREAHLYSFRSFDTGKLREIVNEPIAAGTVAWDLAATVLMERNEKFAPTRPSRQEEVYGPYTLSGEDWDTIREALNEKALTCVGCLAWPDASPHWAVELWAIDRASRALGMRIDRHDRP